ncbi:polysaccharide deacetylase [Penicillium cf. griseofulvum]|nr:polysaccharide deacetylase [Penicillium cf. griseofulvum]
MKLSSWDHKLRLDQASHSEILREMNTLDKALCGLIGRRPTYMRPPYLAINETALKILKDYHVITTDLDTGDGAGSSVAQGFKRFKNGVEAGHSLLLAHDTLPKTVEELTKKMLEHLKTKKIKAVTVGECLGDAPENWYRACDNLTPPSQLQNQPVDREEYTRTFLRGR